MYVVDEIARARNRIVIRLETNFARTGTIDRVRPPRRGEGEIREKVTDWRPNSNNVTGDEILDYLYTYILAVFGTNLGRRPRSAVGRGKPKIERTSAASKERESKPTDYSVCYVEVTRSFVGRRIRLGSPSTGMQRLPRWSPPDGNVKKVLYFKTKYSP